MKKKKQTKKEPEPQLPEPLARWVKFDQWVKQREGKSLAELLGEG